MDHPAFMTLHMPSYTAAFRVDDSGELMETVDFMADGTPDWGAEGPCDPRRGESPALQEIVRAVLALGRSSYS